MTLEQKWGKTVQALSLNYDAATVLATNTSSWAWEDDENTRTAIIYLFPFSYDLFYQIKEKRVKLGLGAGSRETVIADGPLGTLASPKNMGALKSDMGRYSHSRSRAGGPFKAQWTTPEGKTGTLAQILAKAGATPQQGPGKAPGKRQTETDKLRKAYYTTSDGVQMLFDGAHEDATTEDDKVLHDLIVVVNSALDKVYGHLSKNYLWD